MESSLLCMTCLKPFAPTNGVQVYCTKRCAYIGAKLATVAGRRMDRRDAIRYYGEQFDDPIRRFKRGKHKIVLRKLMHYCEVNDTNVFTALDIEAFFDVELDQHAITMVARRTPGVVRVKRVVQDGSSVVQWMLNREDL